MYLPGDILVDLSRRVIFQFPGTEGYDLKKLVRCRLATPGETTIFKREFPGKPEVTFKAFKDVMPVFDGRKRTGIIYGYIPLDEYEFLFFRRMKHHIPEITDNSSKLAILISNYLKPIEHNKLDAEEYAKLKSLKSLLIDLLQDKK